MKNILKLVSNFVFRPKVTGKTITRKTVVLDWISLRDTTLEDCTIVYFGLGDVTIGDMKFIHCTILFSGPAKSTIQLNNGFAAGGWGGLVETYAEGVKA